MYSSISIWAEQWKWRRWRKRMHTAQMIWCSGGFSKSFRKKLPRAIQVHVGRSHHHHKLFNFICSQIPISLFQLISQYHKMSFAVDEAILQYCPERSKCTVEDIAIIPFVNILRFSHYYSSPANITKWVLPLMKVFNGRPSDACRRFNCTVEHWNIGTSLHNFCSSSSFYISAQTWVHFESWMPAAKHLFTD